MRRRSSSCSRCPGRCSPSGSPTSPRSARSTGTDASWRCFGPAVRPAVSSSPSRLSEAAVIGVISGLLGAGLAYAADAWLVKGSVGLTTGRVALVLGICIALAVLGSAAARLATGARALSGAVTEGRQTTQRQRRALWERLYLDLAALALSGLIYWLTATTGFSAVVNPDSNPTLSLSIYMFFAPALLWIGATLLLVRLRGRLFAGLAARLAKRESRDGRSFLLASASRRGAAINRGLILVGLLLAFGVSLGVFAATYDQQAGVDAQLTLGADVTATAPPGVTAKRGLAARIARGTGRRRDLGRRPFICLRRPRPPGHLRDRPQHDRQGHHPA